jgi:hypothetical protein
MVMGLATWDQRDRFAAPPWTQESEEWLALDQRLPADQLARRVDRAVALLDLEPWFASYLDSATPCRGFLKRPALEEELGVAPAPGNPFRPGE